MIAQKLIAEPGKRHILAEEQSITMVRSILQYILDLVHDEKTMWQIVLHNINLQDFFTQDSHGKEIPITKKLLFHDPKHYYIPNELLLGILDNAVTRAGNIDAFTMGSHFIANDKLLRDKYGKTLRWISPQQFVKHFQAEAQKYAPVIQGRMIHTTGTTAWVDIWQRPDITRFNGQANTRNHEELFLGYERSYLGFMGNDPNFIKARIIQSMVEKNTGTMIRADLYPRYNKYKKTLQAFFVNQQVPLLTFNQKTLKHGLDTTLLQQLPQEVQLLLQNAYAEIGNNHTHGIYEVSWKRLPLFIRAINRIAYLFTKELIFDSLSDKRKIAIDDIRNSVDTQLALRNLELEEEIEKMSARFKSQTGEINLIWKTTRKNAETIAFIQDEKSFEQKIWIPLPATHRNFEQVAVQYRYQRSSNTPLYFAIRYGTDIREYSLTESDFKEHFFKELRQIVDDEQIPEFSDEIKLSLESSRHQIEDATDAGSLKAFDNYYREIRRECFFQAIYSRFNIGNSQHQQQFSRLFSYLAELSLVRSLDRDNAYGLTSTITRELIYQALESIEDLRENPSPELMQKALAAVQEDPEAKKRLFEVIPAWLCTMEKNNKPISKELFQGLSIFITNNIQEEATTTVFEKNNFLSLVRMNESGINAILAAHYENSYLLYKQIWTLYKENTSRKTPLSTEELYHYINEEVLSTSPLMEFTYDDFKSCLEYIIKKSIASDVLRDFAQYIYERLLLSGGEAIYHDLDDQQNRSRYLGDSILLSTPNNEGTLEIVDEPGRRLEPVYNRYIQDFQALMRSIYNNPIIPVADRKEYIPIDRLKIMHTFNNVTRETFFRNNDGMVCGIAFASRYGSDSDPIYWMGYVLSPEYHKSILVPALVLKLLTSLPDYGQRTFRVAATTQNHSVVDLMQKINSTPGTFTNTSHDYSSMDNTQKLEITNLAKRCGILTKASNGQVFNAYGLLEKKYSSTYVLEPYHMNPISKSAPQATDEDATFLVNSIPKDYPSFIATEKQRTHQQYLENKATHPELARQAFEAFAGYRLLESTLQKCGEFKPIP